MLLPAEVVDVINILVTPSKDETDRVEPSFISALERNLDALKEKISTQEKFQHLLKKICRVSGENENSATKFLFTAIVLLRTLRISLEEASRGSENVAVSQETQSHTIVTSSHPTQSPVSPVLTPQPLGGNALSVSQEKTVQSLVQFIIGLGICPNLMPGVGISLEQRTGFSEVIKHVNSGESLSVSEKQRSLFHSVKVLIECTKHPLLGTLILSRHLGDVLAALLQMTADKRGSAKQPGLGVDMSCSVVTPSGQTAVPSCGQTSVTSSGQTAGTPSGQTAETPSGQTAVTPSGQTAVTSSGQTAGTPSGHTAETPSGQTVETSTEQNKAVPSKDLIESGNSFGENKLIDVFDLVSAREECGKYLQNLMISIYEPLLVRELLVLQGGMPSREQTKGVASVQMKSPVWLRKKCGRLLSDILTRPRGVQAVIRGILSESAGGDDWQKCAVVGQIIARVPSQVTSAEDYYKVVAPQILELLHFNDAQVQRQFLRVACCTLSAMMTQHPELAQKYWVQPVLNPLLLCTQELNPTPGQVVVCEEKLTECLDDICKILVIGGAPECGLSEALLAQVLVPLFELHCFCLQGISHIRAAAKASLLHYLKSLPQEDAVKVLHALSCSQRAETSASLSNQNDGLSSASSNQDGGLSCARMNPQLEFSPGANGGVMVVGKDLEEEYDEWSQMNTKIEGVMDLLKDLHKDGLAAAFFIYLMKELTSIISKKMAPNDAPVKPGQELLHLEQTHDKQTTDLMYDLNVLQLVAAMSESLGEECLKTTRHTLEFIKVTLEREAKRLELEEAAEEEFEVFGKETLSMAVAMLTMMLGGDQLSSSDKDYMMEFLPLLDNLSRRHCDPFIQSLAGDLRITIATRGKVWLGENSKSFQHMTEKTDMGRNESDGRSENSKKMSEPRPTGGKKLIEEIPQKSEGKDHIKMENNLQETSKKNSEKAGDRTQDSLSNSSDDFDIAFKELFDPFIPTRGHAQIVLARLIRERHPKAMEKWETLAKIFQENLDHEDSYIYLSAIQGLASLADAHPGHLVTVLAAEFRNCNNDGQMEKGRKTKSRSPELRIKLGEVLMKSIRSLGDMVPKFRDLLLMAFLSGTRDPDFLVRASSMSNLGEVCKFLRFSLGPVTQEILTCCSSLVKSDSHVEVRRASVQLITLLLQGLGKDALKVLESELRDLYRLLKHVMNTENDDIIKLHAQLALEELDAIMKQFLFPAQTFTKKIFVLDPPS